MFGMKLVAGLFEARDQHGGVVVQAAAGSAIAAGSESVDHTVLPLLAFAVTNTDPIVALARRAPLGVTEVLGGAAAAVWALTQGCRFGGPAVVLVVAAVLHAGGALAPANGEDGVDHLLAVLGPAEAQFILADLPLLEVVRILKAERRENCGIGAEVTSLTGDRFLGDGPAIA